MFGSGVVCPAIELELPEKCEDCGAKLGDDACCVSCGLGHLAPCGVCGRWGLHDEGCSEIEE
jgi:hypothetical protein